MIQIIFVVLTIFLTEFLQSFEWNENAISDCMDGRQTGVEK